MPSPFRSTGVGLLIISGDTLHGQDALAASGSAGGTLELKGGAGDGSGTGGAVEISGGAAAAAGDGDGGDVILIPGAGDGTGADGIVKVNGVRNYPTGATDPSGPTPSDGDMYYNSALDMAMRFDGARSKWLSVEVAAFLASDSGSLPSGSFFQIGNMRMTSTQGITANFKGTVVGIAYTRSDTDAASFAVTAAGSTIASLASTAVAGNSTSLNANFSQNAVLGMRNDGANALSNGIVYMRVKWRA